MSSRKEEFVDKHTLAIEVPSRFGAIFEKSISIASKPCSFISFF
jgi:hypothetical protein